MSWCLSDCDNGELLQYSLDGSHQAAPLSWPSPWMGSGSVSPISREGQQPPSTVLTHQSNTRMDVWGVLPSEHAVLNDPQGRAGLRDPCGPAPAQVPTRDPEVSVSDVLPSSHLVREDAGQMVRARSCWLCVCLSESSPMRP